MIGAPNSLNLNCKVRVMREAPGSWVSEEIVGIFRSYSIDVVHTMNHGRLDHLIEIYFRWQNPTLNIQLQVHSKLTVCFRACLSACVPACLRPADTWRNNNVVITTCVRWAGMELEVVTAAVVKFKVVIPAFCCYLSSSNLCWITS